MFDVLELSDPRCKEPGTDDVIEEVRFAFLPGMLYRLINDRRCRNLDPRQHPIIERLHVHGLRMCPDVPQDVFRATAS
jgi:hypothetical protein